MDIERWYLKKLIGGRWSYTTCVTIHVYNKLLKWGWFRVTKEEYEEAAKATE